METNKAPGCVFFFPAQENAGDCCKFYVCLYQAPSCSRSCTGGDSKLFFSNFISCCSRRFLSFCQCSSLKKSTGFFISPMNRNCSSNARLQLISHNKFLHGHRKFSKPHKLNFEADGLKLKLAAVFTFSYYVLL